MEKLSFKEYVESKSRLLEAVKQTPIQSVEYVVRKYCKIPLGETKDSKQYISLKPKELMIVKWLYESIDNPTPVSIEFNADETEHETFWSGEKLQKWIARNARENV